MNDTFLFASGNAMLVTMTWLSVIMLAGPALVAYGVWAMGLAEDEAAKGRDNVVPFPERAKRNTARKRAA